MLSCPLQEIPIVRVVVVFFFLRKDVSDREDERRGIGEGFYEKRGGRCRAAAAALGMEELVSQ